MTMALAPTTVTQIRNAGEMKSALQVVKDALAPDLTDSELTLFAMVAQRSGLDPFAKQIYAVKRKGRVTFQTGIDGLRSIAERTGQFVNSAEPEYWSPCECNLLPLNHPEWARVTVFRRRDGVVVEQSATAYWHEYIPGDGQDFQWKKMPRLMLGKCAEALALRKAFPYVLTGIYTPEEMAQAPTDAPARAQRPTARQLVAEKAAAAQVSDIAAVDDEEAADQIVVEATELQSQAIDEAIEEELIQEAESDGRSETAVGVSDSGEVPGPVPPETTPATCGDVAAAGSVAEGEICALEGGHKGPHKNEGARASWPQAK
jgi:phage recombination protein Bet